MKRIDSKAKVAIQNSMKLKGARTLVTNTPGRTNATNPTSMSELSKAFEALKKAEAVRVIPTPNEPTPKMWTINDHYIKMGEAIDMCPYELRTILESDIATDNDLVKAALKKLFTAVKISCDVDLTETRREKQSWIDRNVKQHKQWLDSCRTATERNEIRSENITEATQEFYNAWGKILIDLIQRIQNSPQLSSLGTWDQYMCRALAKLDKTVAVIKNDTVTINFNEARKMAPELIDSLPEVAARIQESDEAMKFSKWLSSATDDELEDQMLGCRDEDKFDAIVHELAVRRDMKVVYDSHGNAILKPLSASNIGGYYDDWFFRNK